VRRVSNITAGTLASLALTAGFVTNTFAMPAYGQNGLELNGATNVTGKISTDVKYIETTVGDSLTDDVIYTWDEMVWTVESLMSGPILETDGSFYDAAGYPTGYNWYLGNLTSGDIDELKAQAPLSFNIVPGEFGEYELGVRRLNGPKYNLRFGQTADSGVYIEKLYFYVNDNSGNYLLLDNNSTSSVESNYTSPFVLGDGVDNVGFAVYPSGGLLDKTGKKLTVNKVYHPNIKLLFEAAS